MDKITEIFNVWTQSQNQENPNSQETTANNLENYSDCLQDVIKKSQEILNASYADENFRQLSKKLKRNINELICIQREIKNHFQNIRSMNNQITAIQSNIKDEKHKLKAVNNEEQRTRMNMETEKSRKEKFENLVLVKRTKKFTLNSSVTEPEDSENFIGPLRRGKARQQKIIEKQIKKKKLNGVTLILKPIEEVQSPNSSPNASIGEFPFSSIAPDLIVSNTNSLMAISNVGISVD